MDWTASDFTIWPLHLAHAHQTRARRALAEPLRSGRSFLCAGIASRAPSHFHPSGNRANEFSSVQSGHDSGLGDLVQYPDLSVSPSLSAGAGALDEPTGP